MPTLGTRAKGFKLWIFPLLSLFFYLFLWMETSLFSFETPSPFVDEETLLWKNELLRSDEREQKLQQQREEMKEERQSRREGALKAEERKLHCVDGHLVPTVFLIGVAKCGTTRTVGTLANSISGLSLTKNPAKFLGRKQGKQRQWASRKELYYLGSDHPAHVPPYLDDEEKRFSQFISHYPNCSGSQKVTKKKVSMEGTPTTYVHPQAFNRLQTFWGPDLSKLLFIVSVCDPVHATESHYRMLMALASDSSEWEPFHSWVDSMMLWHHNKLKNSKPRHAKILQNNIFMDFLPHWIKKFSPNQFLVQVMEDDRSLALLTHDVAKRLRLPMNDYKEGHKNQGLGSSTVNETHQDQDERARERLASFFQKSNEDLLGFFGENKALKVFGLESVSSWRVPTVNSDKAFDLYEDLFFNGAVWITFFDLSVLCPIALSQIYSVLALFHLVCYLFYRLLGVEEKKGTWGGNPPMVTIQILCCDEGHLIRKTIDAACSVDWPVSRFHVQILDDSRKDLTITIIDQAISEWTAAGVKVTAIRRQSRSGFKAGNLKNGAKFIDGEYVLYIDSDFQLSKNSISSMLSLFYNEEGHSLDDVALVQCPWAYYNQNIGPLTRATALEMDYHFIISQYVRSQLYGFFGFNGTAGMWRKSAIFEAGGWECDTLAEDMDLSMRCLGLGYTFRFCRYDAQDSEIPALVTSFQSQRYRWAKGFSQNLRKNWWRVVSSNIPLLMKVDLLLLLCSNFGSVVGLYAVLWSPWLVMAYEKQNEIYLFLLWPVVVNLISLLVVSLSKPVNPAKPYPSFMTRLSRMILAIPLFCVMAANCLNISIAFFDGLLSDDNYFIITPKEGDVSLHSEPLSFPSSSSPSSSSPSFFSRLFSPLVRFLSSLLDFLTLINPFVLAYHVNMLTVLEMIVICYLSYSSLYLLSMSSSYLPFFLFIPLSGFCWMVISKIKVVWKKL